MRTYFVAVALVAAALAAVGALQMDHERAVQRAAADYAGGDPHMGRNDMVSYGCVACHIVPGFPGTNSHVGPSLESFGARTYVAGAAENTPENLIHFIRDPRSVAPKSAMPTLGVSESDARNLAAYLYTLQ